MEARVSKLEQAIGRIDMALGEIKAALPHLATKADVEMRPNRGEMWTMLGVLTAVVLGAVAIGASLT